MSYDIVLIYFSTTRYFINRTIDELKASGGSKTEAEKGVLEKLLDVNKEMAVIMASDMITAGVDTVIKFHVFFNPIKRKFNEAAFSLQENHR